MAQLPLKAAKALQVGRDSRDSSHSNPQQPAHPITPGSSLALELPGGRWADSTELCELAEPGSFCPGSRSGLEAKPRDPRSLTHSISCCWVFQGSASPKSEGHTCLKEVKWPRDRSPSSAATRPGPLLAQSPVSWLCDLGKVISSL